MFLCRGFQKVGKGGQLIWTEHCLVASSLLTLFILPTKHLSASPHLTGEDTEGHGVICLETDVRILNPSPTASKHPELTRQHLLPSPSPRSLCLLCGQEGNGTGPLEGKAVCPSRGNELGLSVIMEANNRWQYTHVTMWCLCSTSRFPFLGSVSFPKKHFL